MHHFFRHIIVEYESPLPVGQVVRKTYFSGFIIILKTGFQITGGSVVHGFWKFGFLDLLILDWFRFLIWDFL
jgi:hypothetical protein